ncbi:DUF4276 family protein [Candidatus Symbiobacter mobilis]|uniref:DUF4276 family protein n=1 Tax=Candidatus Symbiobacter mobilis CR TaxID=946483 RepID=U5NBQ2_9BURK|nr:DUF4276 family protein [Candidatus Symbiobacter mobilis]AGX88750.1 hypothetical protein Cenrod_2704 [Candidatus Symbiobacter mobilis CR]
MQYLSLALYAEGPTDYYFLRALLQRLCEDLCMREACTPVDVSEVLALNHPKGTEGESREQRILAAAKLAQGAWRILFIHADGANDPPRARREQVEPGLALLRQCVTQDGVGVAVVPIRETEAWAIADGDAIRSTFGTSLDNDVLGLPARRHAEAVPDPKAILKGAFASTQPSARRRKQGTSPYLNTLGETISLNNLRELAAFKSLEDELRTALRQLRILP